MYLYYSELQTRIFICSQVQLKSIKNSVSVSFKTIMCILSRRRGGRMRWFLNFVQNHTQAILDAIFCIFTIEQKASNTDEEEKSRTFRYNTFTQQKNAYLEGRTGDYKQYWKKNHNWYYPDIDWYFVQILLFLPKKQKCSSWTKI